MSLTPSAERQKELIGCLKTKFGFDDVIEGNYPFSGMKLNSVDIRWLIECQQNHVDIDVDSYPFNILCLDLRGARLIALDLSGVTLEHVIGGLNEQIVAQLTPDQRRTVTQKAAIDIRYSDLAHAHLKHCHFDNARFDRAKLDRAIMEDCSFNYAHFDVALMNNTTIQQCQFNHAFLSRADLSDAIIDSGSSFVKAKMRHIRCTRSKFKEAILDEAIMIYANLIEAEFDQVSAKSVKLRNAELEGFVAYDATFTFADLQHIEALHATFFHCILNSANFDDSTLTDADLRSSELNYANLKRVYAKGIRLSHVEGDEVVFSESWLEAAEMENAVFTRGDFRSVCIVRSNCSHSIFENADFREATMLGNNMRFAHLSGANLSTACLGSVVLMRSSAQRKIKAYLDIRCAGFQSGSTLLPMGNSKEMKKALSKRIPKQIEKLKKIHRSFAPSFNAQHAALGWREVLLADISWGECSLNGIIWENLSLWRNKGFIGDEQQALSSKEKSKVRHITQTLEAIRANNQLCSILSEQGLVIPAGKLSYRTLKLQRRETRLRGLINPFKLVSYLFSLLLDLITGYGYKPERGIIAYFLVIFFFAALLYGLGCRDLAHLIHLSQGNLSLEDAIILSFGSFHGATLGMQPMLNEWQTRAVVTENNIGFILEISFIVAYTKSFFGK